jgi:hypothetical protein
MTGGVSTALCGGDHVIKFISWGSIALAQLTLIYVMCNYYYHYFFTLSPVMKRVQMRLGVS